jgi:hypothetical protein
MAKNHDMERRLLNWVRWLDGSGGIGLGFGVTHPMWQGVRVDGQHACESFIPTNSIEAEETNRAVLDLSIDLQDTVRSYYVGSLPLRVQAQNLGCGVSTIHNRIEQAHTRMAAWLTERATRAAAAWQAHDGAYQSARVAGLGAAAALVLPPAAKRARSKRGFTS